MQLMQSLVVNVIMRAMKLPLKIIDRYISREIMLSWLAVLFVLVIVVMSADVVRLLAWLVEGRIPGDSVLPLMLNSFYEFLVMLVPLSLLLGVLLAFGRLYQDSEMTAIMSAGLGPWQWFRPLLLVAVPVSSAMLIMTLFVMPEVVKQRDGIMLDISNRAESSTLLAGRFNQSRKGDAIFFLESQSDDGKVMDHVFHSQSRNQDQHVDIAQRAINKKHQNGLEYLVMEDGVHYEGKPGTSDYSITDYKEYGLYVPGSEKVTNKTSLKAMSSKTLWGSTKPLHRAELQWRITIPLATLIIALLALPLSHTTPRSGRYANLALARLMYLVYSNLLGAGRTWILKETIPVWIGTWWVHILALILLFSLLKISGHAFRGDNKVIHLPDRRKNHDS